MTTQTSAPEAAVESPASTAKTSAQRVQEVRDRRKAMGFVRLDVAAHPDDREAIKAYAAKLQKSREKALAKAGSAA